jgi:hypothetical protein
LDNSWWFWNETLKNLNIKVLQGGYRIYLCIRHFLCPKATCFSNCSELSILFNNKRIFLNVLFYWRTPHLSNLAPYFNHKLICHASDFTFIDACISYAGLIILEYQTKSFENLSPFTIPRSMTSRLCLDVMIESFPTKHSLMDFPTFDFRYIYKTCFMCHLILFILQR